ncbi:MAG: type II toxin-antitoxin system PemK/MazF family toxin [Bacteroidia bacterium]|nr:type II toxin-antitoxin system PemK/MazF family toxin [Bacteroidia bacterium]
MNSDSKKIERGQIYFVDLDPVIGSEQGGNRPVLVLQNNIGNRHSPTVIIAPITSKPKSYYLPTHVLLPNELGLPQNSMVLLEQVRTIDKSRLAYLVGYATEAVMCRIDRALGISVGLHELSDAFRDEPERPDEMTLCLCPVCASQFYNSPDHIIRRVNPLQSHKETCTYCDVRNGYDYIIIKKKKRLGDDRI